MGEAVSGGLRPHSVRMVVGRTWHLKWAVTQGTDRQLSSWGGGVAVASGLLS